MYRQMDIGQRAKELEQLNFQLDVLEGLAEGPYLVGEELSSADAALFPTFVFMTFILEGIFGWEDVFKGRPKLRAYWDQMNEDVDGKRVRVPP
jgi:glutathione S-transferase